jgi:hypothetical protein
MVNIPMDVKGIALRTASLTSPKISDRVIIRTTFRGGTMSIQGSKANIRLMFPPADGAAVQTYPNPGDFLIIQANGTDGVHLQLERNGVVMRFQITVAYELERLPLRTGTLATRMMVEHLAGLVSLMSGLDLVCVSDEMTKWTYVFREQPRS